jgi:hypothetical protein
MHMSEYGASARRCSESGRMCAKMSRTMFARSKVVCRRSDLFAGIRTCSQTFGRVRRCLYMFVGVVGLRGGFPLHHPPFKAQRPDAQLPPTEVFVVEVENPSF